TLGALEAGVKCLLQSVRHRNRITRNRHLAEHHLDRLVSAIVALQAGVKTVLGALPGQPGKRRSLEHFDARVSKAFLFLSLISQESPLQRHVFPLFPESVSVSLISCGRRPLISLSKNCLNVRTFGWSA